MRLSCDILDLPELESTLAPTIRFEQEDVPSVKKTQKRRSLMSLRRERMRSTATLSNDVGTDGNRLRNESLPQRARMLAGHASSMTACAEPTLPCLTANTKCFLSWMPEHHEAKGALLCNVDCCALPQEAKTIASGFLAGAAALGLRRQRNRATSEPPVQPRACFSMASKRGHLTSHNVKEKICADETSAMARSQQKVKEPMLVPHAPRKPQSENHRKRPQIRGVPILMIPRG